MSMPLWLIYALISAVFASLVGIFTKIGVTHISPALAGTIKAIIMAIFFVIFSFAYKDFKNLNQLVTYKKDFFFLILTGILGGFSWYFMNLALKHGSAMKVMPVDKLSIVITIFLAFIVLKENLTPKILLGAIFITIGVILVALK